MNGRMKRIAQRMRSVFCVLLAAMVVTGSLCAGNLTVSVSGLERTFDIGVNSESVTAVLDENGLLTVSGSGEIRDFTPETAPFANMGVSRIKLGADITAVGDYAFYDCGAFTAELSLPAGLVRIGDGAFSGSGTDSAPVPAFVENPFAGAMVTRKKAEASPTPEATPAPEAAKATAQVSPDPSDSPQPSASVVESAPEQEGAAAAVKSDALEKAASLPGTNGLAESSAVTPEPTPPLSPEPEKTPAPTETPEAEAALSPAPSEGPTVSPSAQPEEGNRFTIESVTEQEIGQEIFSFRTDRPAFTCSGENHSFRSAMEQAGFVEADRMVSAAFDCGEGISSGETALLKDLPVVEGVLTLPQVLPEFSAPDGGDLFSYAFSGWTESRDEANLVRAAGSQFPVEDKEDLYFIASWDQKALVKIQVSREGEEVVFSLPEIEGYDVLSCRWELCSLAAGEEPPVDQSLLPWQEIPEAAETVYRRTAQPGDENRLFRCVATVKKKGFSFFSLAAAGNEEELALEAVAGAAYFSENAYFISCEKGTGDGMGEPGGEAPLPVEVQRGDYGVIPACPFTAPETTDGTVVVFNGWAGSDGKSYDPGQIILLSGNLTLTARWAAATVRYVNGEVNAEDARNHNGQTKDAAYKGFVTESYMFYNYPGAYDDTAFNGGSKYTNIIVVCGKTEIGEVGAQNATITNWDPINKTTYSAATLTIGGKVEFGGDTYFRDIKMLSANVQTDRLLGQGHQLLLGEGITMDGSGYHLEVYGGNNGNASNAPSEVIVQSGTYAAVYGGCRQGNITGSTKVEVSGNADIGVVCGAGWLGSSLVTGDTEVYVSGEARVAAVLGGNRSSDGQAGVTGRAHVMVGGSARIEENATVKSDTSFVSTGFVAGSGADSCLNEMDGTLGNVRGGTFVEIRENAYVATNVLGGSGDGWVNEGQIDQTIENPYALLGTAGKTEVLITGNAEIGGSVYGGGNNRSCKDGASVTVESGVIRGSVYGGGLNGNVGGDCTVSVGGTALVSQNIYGGGKGMEAVENTGTVTGGTTVSVTGGHVGLYTGSGEEVLTEGTGSVFGGGEFGRVDGDSAVEINASGQSGHPTVGRCVYGGGSQAVVQGKSSAHLIQGRVGTAVYGGGYGEGSSSGSTEVRIEGGTVGDNVYGGGAKGTVSGQTSVWISGGVMHNVFAAGEGSESSGVEAGRVLQSASVVLSGGEVTGGLYGGGYLGLVGSGSDIAADGDVKDGSTSVTVSGGTVNRVFAGGSGSSANPTFGSVFGNTTLTINGGSVAANVYGGSNYAYVTGDTKVTVKAQTAAVSVGGSVFGGGNLNRTPEEGFDDTAVLVYGDATLLIDGSGPGVTLGGAVLGSGNLTRVQGIRTITIQDFTGAIASLQRANLVTVSNSEITLVGEDDVTDDQGTKLFSITKINDMRLCSSVLKLESEARELAALGNYDGSGAVSTAESARSTIQATPGLLLQVRSATDYGPVSGAFWLEMAGAAAEGMGVRVEGSYDSATGDGKTDTGAFVKSPSETREMVSGKIGTAHSYWRLGGSVLERKITIAAPRGTGQSTVSQSIQLPTSGSGTAYTVTKFQKTGSFSLVLPEETGGQMVLPAFTGSQTADNTFALRVDPVGSGWSGLDSGSYGAYALTAKPAGEAEWNSGVEGVWVRGEADMIPATASADGEISFSLVYDASYGSFSSGEVDFTFQEYPQGEERNESTVLNTMVVKVTLEGDQHGSSQTAAVAGGRVFTEFTGTEEVGITSKGAVSAAFLTEYYPVSAGAENMFLCLCRVDGETVSPAAFPAGTKLVLGDQTTEGRYGYYYCKANGEEKISLSQFNSLSAEGGEYPGPTDITIRISEKLLFAVDFSSVESGLENGSYFLALTHGAEEKAEDGARAAFSVTGTGDCSLAMTKDEAVSTNAVFGITLTPSVNEADTRYANGACIHLSLTHADGEAAGFPEKVTITGDGENVLRDRDGTVSFTLPASGTSLMAFDFTSVPDSMLSDGDYVLTAVMTPRVGLQVGSDQGTPDASPAPLPFTLKRTEEVVKRALRVTMSEGSQRLVDAAEAPAVLEFIAEYGELQSGDRLELEVLQKIGSTPDSSSYIGVGNPGDWDISPAPGELSGTQSSFQLTVPKGQTAGTYRLQARIVDSAGEIAAQQPYNFIVK